MKKGSRQVYAAGLALAVILSGCGQAPAAESQPVPTAVASLAPTTRWIFALPYFPGEELHPITGTNRVNLTLMPLLYRGLFALNERFEAQNDLCESYTVSEDGLTWTFTLKEAAFSDGSPLTTAEVVASLNRARRNARFSSRLADIKTVGVVGDTVVVTLSRANGSLPELLDVPIVKETGEDRPLGTGAYALEETDEGMTLVAREGTLTPLPSIPLRAVEGGDDLIYAFDAAEISLVDTDLTGANALGYSGRLESTDYDTSTLIYVGMNTTRTSICREQTIRQAVSLVVDRDDAVERLLAGHAVASTLLIHSEAKGYDGALGAAWARDPLRAAELLDAGGYLMEEDGVRRMGRTELTLRFLVNSDNSYKVSIAEALCADLEVLGCAVTLEKLPWDDFVVALKGGNFDLYLGETVMTADFDPAPLVGTNGALNYGRFSDRELDAAIDRWRAAAGEERATLAGELYPAIAEAAPVAPICFKNGSVLTQWGQVGGMAPTQRDVFAGLENWEIGG